MKNARTNLKYDTVYHIYNSGIDGCPLFKENIDYDRFLSAYSKYIDSIADTYAWCLMNNHFHFLIKTRKEENIKTLKELKLLENKVGYLNEEKKPTPSRQFAHLFNSYANYFNIKYKRRGALFISPFKRKVIDNREYFKRCLIYIHQNPIKHGFVTNLQDYQYTSFHSYFRDEKGFVNTKTVLELFDNLKDFEKSHDDMIFLI